MNALTVILKLHYAIGVAFFFPTGLIGETTVLGTIMNHHFACNYFSVRRNVQRAVMLCHRFWAARQRVPTHDDKHIRIPWTILGFLQLVGSFCPYKWHVFASHYSAVCRTSLALIIRIGASTGGMDIPPLVLNKYFKVSARQPIRIWLYNLDWQDACSLLKAMFAWIVPYSCTRLFWQTRYREQLRLNLEDCD